MDTRLALLLKTTIKLIKYVKHLFGALENRQHRGMESREVGSTHSEPRVYPGCVPGSNFLTTAQTVRIWVERGGPVELGKQRLDLGAAGALGPAEYLPERRGQHRAERQKAVRMFPHGSWDCICAGQHSARTDGEGLE